MQKDPTLRPSSAAEVARRLQLIQKQEGLRLSEVIVENEAPLPLKGGGPIVDEDRTHVPAELPEVSAPVAPRPPAHHPSEPVDPIATGQTDTAGLDPTSSAVEAKRARVTMLALAVLILLGGFIGWTILTASGDVEPEREDGDFEPEDDEVEIIPTPDPPDALTGVFLDQDTVLFEWSIPTGATDESGTTWRVVRTDTPGIPFETVESPSIEISGLDADESPCINVATVTNGVSSDPTQNVCATR